MTRHLPPISSPAPRRLGLLRTLAFLLLAGGLLWSWTQARAAPLSIAGSELAGFSLLEAAGEPVLESAARPDAGELCRKPAPVKDAPVERLLNEAADPEVLPHDPVGQLTARVGPVCGPQPALAQTEPQPLLRPPARPS